MPDAKLIFTVLGPLFLALGLVQRLRKADAPGRQGRTWLIVGTVFSAVALWLWLRDGRTA